jgi:hypothetical protein
MRKMSGSQLMGVLAVVLQNGLRTMAMRNSVLGLATRRQWTDSPWTSKEVMHLLLSLTGLDVWTVALMDKEMARVIGSKQQHHMHLSQLPLSLAISHHTLRHLNIACCMHVQHRLLVHGGSKLSNLQLLQLSVVLV